MKKIIALCTVLTLTLGGCSLKKNTSAKDMESDKPWNNTIIETDSGYYFNADNSGGVHALRYIEKSTGTDIFLCAKPECSHTGEETCAATYDYMSVSNYILYDGSIYFVGDTSNKETLGYSLFKVSLDGTTLDKIGDVKRVKQPSNEQLSWGNMQRFVIHKGCAYIFYHFGDSSYTQFIESGFVKMDIKSGKTELLSFSDNYLDSCNITVLEGVGDYLYYSTWSNTNPQLKNGISRYNVNDGSTEFVGGKLYEDYSDQKSNISVSGYTEDTIYAVYYTESEKRIIGYDAKTFEPNGVEIDLSDKRISYTPIFYYDNKIYVTGLDEIMVFSNKGELLGTHEVKSFIAKNESPLYTSDERIFDISNGKMYLGYRDSIESANHTSPGEAYTYYCCSLSDIEAGTGNWEKAYSIKGYREYFGDKSPQPKYISEYLQEHGLE